MKPGAGKRKGSAFEREICKELSRWASGGRRDDLFWRSAGSGSRATAQLQRGRMCVVGTGDVVAVSRAGSWLTDRVIIETKHVRNLFLDHDLVWGTSKAIRPFWTKLQSQAKAVQKVPWLIAKQNGRPIVSVHPTSFWQSLRVPALIMCSTLDLVVVDFEELLELISPREFRHALDG